MTSPVRIGFVGSDEKYRDHIADVLSDNPAVANLLVWNSGEEFWGDEAAREIELLLVDTQPERSGVELTRRIAERDPETKVVMLTAASADEDIVESLQAGAVGLVLKSEMQDLNEIVRQIMAGGAVITPTIASRFLRTFKKGPPSKNHSLTGRELQILEAMASGLAPRKTAEHFKLSEKTVRAHVRNIYRKLNVNNQIELMKKAYDLGLG